MLIATMCAAMVRAAPASAQQHGPITHAARVGASAGGSAVTATAEGVVNVNTATEDELRRLPGVGPSRATAIVALRQRVQRFHAAEDLLRVRGIGRAGLRRMRAYVSLTGETTLASRPRRAPAGAVAEGG
ncbi:MAG: ComEA family DNA-binding protein, partial [Deltaproteobacteria bacterium]